MNRTWSSLPLPEDGAHSLACDVWLDVEDPECNCDAWKFDPDAARDAQISDEDRRAS